MASLAAKRAASDASGRVASEGVNSRSRSAGVRASDSPKPGHVHHVDADADDGHGYSTVTDLARLRGWSTSWPMRVASSHAKSWSGTTATTGCRSVGTFGSRISSSAYGDIDSSPSSASTMVWAPRARISWMALTIFGCSSSRPSGGTMQKTGSPSSIRAIGPCLSSPAAKPSAWM